ncbi:MAG: alpha/beta hydrolase [Spirochaetota bacterium]
MVKTDILGRSYKAMVLQLPDDEEGKVIATLVRRKPRRKSKKAVLYIHGYTDYFFQTEMADKYIENKFNFYALDLRKYGRSLLPHQTPNFCKNVEEYFAEINWAVECMRNDGNEQILLNGHSTGGLVSALYAHHVREKNPFTALFLNSPFFEFNENFLARKLFTEIVSVIAEKDPYRKLPRGISELYAHSVHKDFQGEWDFNTDWKPIHGFDLYAGWLWAIAEGHKTLQAGLDIPCPVLVMFSDKSCSVSEWDDQLLVSDSILNVEHISKYADVLGDHITKIRIKDGMHDLVLSKPYVRANVYRYLFQWLRAYIV